jgi:tRNA(fMet)-specific endonuclease VapC
VILDTSVLIAAERGRFDLPAMLRAFADQPVHIAAITASELLHGCHRANDPGIRARRKARVEAVLDLLPVLPFGMAEARRHAELWADLATARMLIGPHDMLIAATAIAHGEPVATLNRDEFSRAAGVTLLDMEPFHQ